MSTSTQFRVESIESRHTWAAADGPMLGWRMTCTNLETGGTGLVDINSRTTSSYNVGDTFWAERMGQYNGAVKLKRVKPPLGDGNAPEGLPAPKNGIVATPTRVTYERAVEVYNQMALENPEAALIMFQAWLDGKIEDPK